MKAELVTLEGEDIFYYEDSPEMSGFFTAIAAGLAKAGKGIAKGVSKRVRKKRKKRAAKKRAAKLKEQAERQAAINRMIALQQLEKKKKQQLNLSLAMLPLVALPLLLGE